MAYGRWGGGRLWRPERHLSILELVKNGTLDLKLAALLWLMMEHRASVLVAAGPSFAGKTTTFNVLRDFLPPSVKQVELRGYGEDFAFLEESDPSQTYLVAEEFSDYMDYVWGDTAQRAFQLLTEGYGLGGTIHARTAQEVLYVLNGYLEIPVRTLAHLDAIVMLRAAPPRLYGSQPLRHIESVSLVLPHEEGIAIQVVASREMGSDRCVIAEEKGLQSALAAKLSIGMTDVAAETAERETRLAKLLKDGRVTRDEVRKSVVKFYDSRRGEP